MQETTFCEIIELERIPWQHTDSPQSEESFISTAISFTQGKIHLVYLVLLMIRDLFGPHSALTLIDELPSLCKLKFWSLSVSVSLFSWCSLKCIICSFFLQGRMRRIDAVNILSETHTFWINRRILMHLAALHQNFCSVQDFWSWKHACTLNSAMDTTMHELNQKSNSIAFVYSCANLLVWAAIQYTHDTLPASL